MNNEFWDRIEVLLKEQGKYFSFLCSELNISNQNLSNFKARSTIPRAHIALQMAKLLGVSLEYLLYGTETEAEAKTNELKKEIKEAIAKLKEIEKKL
jgi:transcriptional regulator with XRE-family HTH domain